MRSWSPLEWISYGGLGLTTIFLAWNAAILTFPAIRKQLPRRLRAPGWGFLPIACFAIATIAFVGRELFPPLPPANVVAIDTPTVAAPAKPDSAPPSAIPLAAPIGGSDDFSLMSNDALKKRALEFAQEIMDFQDGFFQQKASILHGSAGAKLSPAEKADQVMAIETDASEKFKQKFVAEYLPLQAELIKRSTYKTTMKQFGQTSLDLQEIEHTAFLLQDLAKGVQ